jgi:Ca-activated chloride channel family protein
VFRGVPAAFLAALAAVLILTPDAANAGAQRLETSLPENSEKLPRAQTLGRGVVYVRDPATGEVRSASAEPAENPVAGAIQSRVTLVQVACTVTTPDGVQVRGLTQGDFRLFEDGVEQKIASFDAAATPARIALVIDASPSIYRELGQMREAARSLAANLSPADEIAVVSFSAEAHLLLPFSRDRKLLDRALRSSNLARVEDSSQSNIYRSVFLTARELFSGRTGRKAIVLLTDGQDSSLGLTWDPASASPGPGAGARRLAFDDVARELGADGIDLFVVSTEMRPRAMTPEWLETHRGEMLVTKQARRLEIPHYTLYLAELARRVGGSLYFLREVGNLSDIYRHIALTISAQYTLGYYPTSGTSRPGWRSLEVKLAEGAKAPPGSRVAHRAAYYVSALP